MITKTTSHRLTKKEQARIVCQCCKAPAFVSEGSHWTTGGMRGISFWYWCEAHRPLTPEEQSHEVSAFLTALDDASKPENT